MEKKLKNTKVLNSITILNNLIINLQMGTIITIRVTMRRTTNILKATHMRIPIGEEAAAEVGVEVEDIISMMK